MTVRRTTSSPVAAVAVTVLSVVLFPGTARAAPNGDAEARAAAAATRVTRLAEDYRRHSAAAAKAALDLSRAYAAVAAAEETAERAHRQLDAAATGRTSRTLALYAYGAGVRPELALLVADSPEDGLWQLTVGTTVAEQAVLAEAGAEHIARARAAKQDATAVSADRAARRLGQALARVREEATAAQLSLDGAREAYRVLAAQARAVRAARKAAAELARARAAAQAGGLGRAGSMTALAIPPEFSRTYRDAATTCPGLDWHLLAAVGQVESGHGRNNGPSSAGAIGPMQFMPATFASYGVDGDGDGTKDAWDPQDAIFTAARYLCASGAGAGPDGVRRALFTYNHAQWYVDLVLSAQRAIATAHPS